MDQRPTYEELETGIHALHIEIEALRNANRAVGASEALHRITLENISDTVIITDDHGTIIYACPNAGVIFGLSQDQVYARSTIQELIGGNACDLSQLRKVQEIPNIEWTVLHQSGREKFVLITVKSVSIQGGTVLYVMRDITARKKMELEQALQEKEYRTLVESMPDFVVRYDLDLRLTYVNPAWEKASGLSAADVINVPPTDIPRDSVPSTDAYIQKLRQVLRTGVIETIEFSWINANGVRCFMDYHIVPEYAWDGKISGLLAVGRDITRKKQAEEALRKSEQKWRNILTNIPQIGISLDPRARIVFANRHFLELSGWEKEAVIGKNWFDLFIPEGVREEVQAVFHAGMIQNGTTDFSTYQNEIKTRTGKLRTIAWSNVLTKDAQEEIADVTCLGIDLTERRMKPLRKSASRRLPTNR